MISIKKSRMAIIRDQHFFFFSFRLSNFKRNLIFFNFEFVTRKRNNKSLTVDLVTRNEIKYFSTYS